jgi:hypothetical protein
MTTVPKDDFRPLLYLVPLGAVAATIVVIFFFLLLSPRHPATTPAVPGPPALAPEPYEVPLPSDDDMARGSSPEAPVGNLAANPIPGTLPRSDATRTEPPSDREASGLESTAMDPTLIPPAGIIHAKRVGVGRRHHQATRRHGAALWRPDARAGPLPGGGFYTPPNVNIGYINPNGVR